MSKKDFKITNLWKQLSNAITMQAKQDQIIWTIFSVFWAANVLLVVALFSTGHIPDNIIVVLLISIVGIVLSLIWYIIQVRAINWLEYYEIITKEIEDKLEIPNNYSISSEKNISTYKKTIGNKRGMGRITMKSSGLFFLITWSIEFLICLFELICQL